jgi:hypothetical protein
MSNPRYPEEFKIQAVNQMTQKKLPDTDLAARIDTSLRNFVRTRAGCHWLFFWNFFYLGCWLVYEIPTSQLLGE